MSKKITNVDAISALIDRLVCENIKLYFFTKNREAEKLEHQREVINEIKRKISRTLKKCLSEHEYDFIEERRTFNIADVVGEIEKLTDANIEIGENDRMALQGAKDNDFEKTKEGIFNFRFNNELRSLTKIKIDKLFKKILK